MNRRIHVVWGVSIFAILCLLIFQGFWLNRMIEFKKIEYLNLINNILSGAIESGFEEYVVGNRTISKNPVRVSIHSSDNTVKFVWKGDTTIVDYDKDAGYLGVFRKVCYDLIQEQSSENIYMLDCNTNTQYKIDDTLEKVSVVSKDNKIKYDEIQKKAIYSGVNNNITIITGGPGTGKTTIVKAIVNILIHE